MVKKMALYCSSLAAGGLELNIANLFNHLAQRADMQIIGFFHAHGSIVKFIEPELSSLIHPIETPEKRLARKDANKIAVILQKKSISNLLISHPYDLAISRAAKKQLSGNLNIIFLQQMMIKRSKRGPAHAYRYRAVDHWIAPLPYLKKQVLRYTWVPKRKISICPLCFSENRIKSLMDSRKAKQQLYLDPLLSYVGVLGRVDPHKQQDKVISSFIRMFKAKPTTGLIIMGDPTAGADGSYLTILKKLISDAQMENRIFLRPFMNDISVFFSVIDLFVMPSDEETFGMVTIEALAHGLPVLGADTYGTGDLLRENQGGTTYSSKKLSDLGTKMQAALEDTSLKKAAIENAESVKEKYSITRQADHIFSLCS